jgi:CysZ protein
MLLGFSGFAWLVRHPASWLAACVPALVWALLSALGVSASVLWLQPWLLEALPAGSEALSAVAAWALSLLVAGGAVYLALLVTPPLSAPALERLVDAVESERRAPARSPQTFAGELWCGLRATLLGALLVSPLLLLALVLDLIFPALAPLWFALKALAGALGLSFGLLDYPLTLRGTRMRDRLSLMRRHAAAVVGFGLGMLPFFWLPCCLFVALPVGVIAATLFQVDLLNDDQALAGAGAPIKIPS